MVTRIGERFELGGHKAAAIGMVLQKARVFLVSEMDPDFVRTIFLEPYTDVQSALTAAQRELGEQATVIVMPHGGSTLPIDQGLVADELMAPTLCALSAARQCSTSMDSSSTLGRPWWAEHPRRIQDS